MFFPDLSDFWKQVFEYSKVQKEQSRIRPPNTKFIIIIKFRI